MRTPHRDEARALGLTHYFPEKPCRNGHPGKRYANNGECCQCRRAVDIARLKGPKRRAAQNEYSRRHIAKYPERRVVVRLKNELKKYGLDLADYENLLKKQNGSCAICGAKTRGTRRGTRLVLDHDHKSGKVRGLLCDGCNVGLGRFRDNPRALRRAALYLENAP